ncbi:uncharacterized protein BDR25DRAFT_344812 [Lindgomyces ingoldianus]|uniref:Uncharacterized protein n=1 Tax=Lindgomyces ingoldianus TaxID=673940 RepID=A0ACB6QLJ5_9PLEO|nr:uncharacterized protein BDR25DRAFT_344812 [Lindgomyces ingoldianus]KAF2467395.1 hypothetical protein BDR25DRAFT_344812 [Lindgomyces ingoldianus]
MQRIKYRYSALYKEIAAFPALANFQRYTEEWAWILYNDSLDIKQKRKECDDLIADIKGFPRGKQVFTVTDWHPIHPEEENPMLTEKVHSSTSKLNFKGKDLLLAYEVAQLPSQRNLFAKRFRDYPNLFKDEVFGPTGESEEIYKQVPAHSDTCSLKDIARQDPVTEFFINNLESMYTWVSEYVLRRGKKLKDNPEMAERDDGVAVATISAIVEVLTCLCVPLYMTITMFLLSCFRSTKVQIAILAPFGTFFVFSLKVMVGPLPRYELFAITAQYLAVLGIFIGASSTGR